MKKELKLKRSFDGPITEFTDKEERAFQKKHLNAYLRGWEFFRHGYSDYEDPATKLKYRVPAWFMTKQVWS